MLVSNTMIVFFNSSLKIPTFKFTDFYFSPKICIFTNSSGLISNMTVVAYVIFQNYIPKILKNKAFLVPNLKVFCTKLLTNSKDLISNMIFFQILT